MDNMSSIMKRHNKKVTGNKSENIEDHCPLENKCLTTSLVYKACVVTEQNTEATNHIGLTKGTFKHRFNRHQLSFRIKNYRQHRTIQTHVEIKKQEKTASAKH